MNENNGLYNLISNVLEIDINAVNKETSPDNTDSWDSLNMVKVVIEIEKEFGVRFELDDISDISNVGDIVNLLKDHKIDL